MESEVLPRKPYPTDLSDEERAFVAPYLTLMAPEALHRVYALREVINPLRWIVRAGAPWWLLPTNFPPWPRRLLADPALAGGGVFRSDGARSAHAAALDGRARTTRPRLSGAPWPSRPGASIGRILSCLRKCIA
jgi:transposase